MVDSLTYYFLDDVDIIGRVYLGDVIIKTQPHWLGGVRTVIAPHPLRSGRVSCMLVASTPLPTSRSEPRRSRTTARMAYNSGIYCVDIGTYCLFYVDVYSLCPLSTSFAFIEKLHDLRRVQHRHEVLD